MYKNGSLFITESEKNKIRNMYGNLPKKDYVFDFVLTENHKYLILMDNVFVNGGDGNSIGTIWENTHIFNELINESISKSKTINESIQKEITEFVSEIKWTKELVKEYINSKEIIDESWYNSWDDFKSGVKGGIKWVSDKVASVATSIFKQGVLPALRWIRRGLYTGVGIVIDVVASIMLAKTNAIVWFVIVCLDIYEIATGDYDPKDPDRQKLPFFFLMADLLGCIFTGAVAFGMRKSAQVVAKEGITKAGPVMVKMVEGLAQKLPSLKSQLGNIAKTLEKKLGSSGVMSTILRGIDNVLGKFSSFLTQLLSKRGAAAVGTGVVVYGTGKALEHGIAKYDKEGKVGKFAVKTNQYLQDKFKAPPPVVDDESKNAILAMANQQQQTNPDQ